jgi:hypothetical protein
MNKRDNDCQDDWGIEIESMDRQNELGSHETAIVVIG